MASFVSPGPNCTHRVVFNDPKLNFESVSYLFLASSSDFHPNSSVDASVLLKSSARQDQLPTTWITPGSPDLLTRSTVPIYAAASAHPLDLSAPTLWIPYLNNDSASPITTPSAFSIDSTLVNQTWRTIACNVQNITYSLDVRFVNSVSAVSIKSLSVTPLLTPVPTGWETTSEEFYSPYYVLLPRLLGYVLAERNENPNLNVRTML